jgi:hypothetical protein
MKNVILSALCLSLLVLTACQRDDDPVPTTSDMLMGKWKLQKAIDEYYQPINVLLETDEVIGEADDSIVFKNNSKLYSYSATYGEEVTEYQVLNDTTLLIEDELYKIRKLTNTELNLFLDHTEQSLNERYVQKLYFIR